MLVWPSAEDWRWSSVQAHLNGCPDGVTTLAPVLERYPCFTDLIAAGPDQEAFEAIRRAESFGRPLGGHDFTAGLEAATQRTLEPGKRGPKTVRLSDRAIEE